MENVPVPFFFDTYYYPMRTRLSSSLSGDIMG